MPPAAILIFLVAMEAGYWREVFTRFLEKNWVVSDSAHDIHHLHRVWRLCQQLNAAESNHADNEILTAACYFHDYITFPKNHPERHHSSHLSAQAAEKLLVEEFPEFPKAKIEAVGHAIRAHSFSARVEVESLEAAILQDADRMEALGAMGIARLFYTAGKMNSELFHPKDPLGERRKADDQLYALDHIGVKLMNLPSSMKTRAGREMAACKAEIIINFRNQIVSEIL